MVPAAPIGQFRLIVFGGKSEYLVNTRDICKRMPIIGVKYTAQNAFTRSSG